MLTHDYIIYSCCKVLGNNWKTLPYALLVHDLAIGDQSVDEIYMTVIKDLGLEISLEKTYKWNGYYEFAKRMFLDGV